CDRCVCSWARHLAAFPDRSTLPDRTRAEQVFLRRASNRCVGPVPETPYSRGATHMNRYRLALAAAAAVIAAAVILTIVRQPTPATLSSGGNGALFPASERIAAPEFIGLDGWVNSPPLSIAGLHGHVVLIDFWTFSCVNCVRTLPHLQELYSAYRGYGFVLVGVHSPEFDFEKNRENVAAAVRRLEVTWPVALDSSMATWGAYNNRYWPAEYLIDQNGRFAY